MLMRALTLVEADGKLSVPKHIRREIEIKAGQLVELKVVVAITKTQLLLSAAENAR